MAITFPTNPSDGQTTLVGQTAYIYNATTGVWDASQSPVIISASAPSSAAEGVFWWNSTTGGMYIRYDGQWITAGNGADGLDGAAGADATVSYANTSSFPTSGNTAGDMAFAEDTKALYVWDGVEWDRVHSGPDEVLTWVTEPPAEFLTAEDSSLSIEANDPDGFPVTYDFVTNPSNQSSAIITNNNDGTFSIVSTDTTDSDFTTKFTATDGVHVISKSTTIKHIDFITASTTVTNGLHIVDAGTQLYLTGSAWESYTSDLPAYLKNTWGTNSINDGSNTITVDKPARIWYLVNQAWSAPNNVGYTLYETISTGGITSYAQPSSIYYKDVDAGTHTIDTYSAMYFITAQNGTKISVKNGSTFHPDV